MADEKEQWKGGVLSVVVLAILILVVDTTMMNVAIPNLVTDLNTTVDVVQAMINALDAMNTTFMVGLIILIGGAGIYAGQLKKKDESLVKGDIDYDEVDFDVDEEKRYHVDGGEGDSTEIAEDPPGRS